MSDPLPDGFWGLRSGKGERFHFFLEGEQRSLCGQVDADEIPGDPERRRVEGMDCKLCAGIYGELYAARPPVEPGPDWTVKSDPITKQHTLYYQGDPQSTVRGPGGLATQKELADIFNRNGTLPKKGKKMKCAADAPDPARYVAKHAEKSPELPLSLSINSQPPTINSMTTKAKPFTSPPIDTALPPAGEMPANQLRRAPDNRIITKEQREKMSDSIREVGVLQPLTVRPVENTETGAVEFEIVLGECRWQGCMELDENYPVPCFVRNLSDKDASRIRAIENFQRKDLDEIEEAKAIQNLKDTGWEMDEISQFLGREKTGLYLRLTLLKLSDEGQAALREKNITINTAAKLASLPDEQREEALKAVVSPTHAAKALPERQALELLDRDFIEPAKRAKEWDKRREVILENHPGARWQAYELACKTSGWNSGYVRAEAVPTHDLLSDAARSGELVVPTWGALAKKHGAEVLIGCNHSDEAFTYVEPKALIDAEKAAFSQNPSDCIFVHEEAVAKARAESEKRKLEQEAHRQALAEEEKRLVAMVLAPDGIGKAALKKLVERVAMEAMETEIYLTDYRQIFAIEEIEDESSEDLQKRVDGAVLKYLRSKNFTALEAMGRIQLAAYLIGYRCTEAEIFETGMAKPADFPAHHKDYLEEQAKAVAREKAAAEAGAKKEGEAA